MSLTRALIALALVVWMAVAGQVWAQSAGPTPALSISCTGTVCTLDASASTGNAQLTYSFECNRLPVQTGCGVRSTAPSVAVTYPADGSERTVRVTVWDTDNVSKQSDWLTFRPGAPTPTPTLPPPSPTATSTVTPTSTPSPTATDTPAPTATATSTAAACPGVYLGASTIDDEVLIIGCRKQAGTPWPDRMVFETRKGSP